MMCPCLPQFWRTLGFVKLRSVFNHRNPNYGPNCDLYILILWVTVSFAVVFSLRLINAPRICVPDFL